MFHTKDIHTVTYFSSKPADYDESIIKIRQALNEECRALSEFTKEFEAQQGINKR